MPRILSTVLGLAAALAPLLPGQEEAKAPKKPLREVLAGFIKIEDKAARLEELKKEILPRGEEAIAPLQEILDVLIPLYREAKEDRNRITREKLEVPALDPEQVRSWIDAVIRKGEKPRPELAKAGALGGLQVALDPLVGARTALVRPFLMRFLDEQAQAGVSYPGQYAPLKQKYGRAAMAVLLQIGADQQGLEDERLRLIALRALADVAEPDPQVLSALRKVSTGEHDSKEVRLAAAVTLARLGHQDAMEPFFEEAMEMTRRPQPKARAKGLRQAGQLWHQIGENAKAVEFYSQLLTILEEITDPKDRTQMLFLGSDYYSRACAYAALGKIEEGIADLKKAVEVRGVTAATLQADREIDPLRKHPDFGKLVDSAPSRLR